MERSALQQLATQIDDLFDLGRIDEGQHALTTALEKSQGIPAYERYFQAEAAWYLHRSSKEQGRLLHEAVELAPDDIFLLRGVGIWQLMSNKTWSAVRTFDKVLALDPHDADTLRCMGIAHSRLDRDRKAIAFFEGALAVNPHDYETRLNMALVLKKQRGEETWLERISIRLGRWFNRMWGKLLDLAGLR